MTRLDRLEVLRDIENIWLVNIYNTLVELDFINADIVHYFKHLAQAIAI